MTGMTDQIDALLSGLRDPDATAASNSMAALSAVQALLLALVESETVDREFLVEALGDAVARHRIAAEYGENEEEHLRAVGALEQLISDCDAAEISSRH